MYSACKLTEQGENIQPWCTPFPILNQSFNTVFSSVQFSHSVVSSSLQPHELQHARPPCPSPTPRVHPNPCPSSRWCHPTISSSVVPFSCIVLYWNKQNLLCSLTLFYLGIMLCIAQEYIGWTCSSPGTLKAAIYISTKMQIDDYRSFSVRIFREKNERKSLQALYFWKRGPPPVRSLHKQEPWKRNLALSTGQLGPPYPHFKLC